MSKLKVCVKHGWDQFFLSGLRDQNFGKMGLRDQNNGKKIGINGSRIYHVTTLILFLLRKLSPGLSFHHMPGIVNRTFENRTQSNSIELNLWIEFD